MEPTYITRINELLIQKTNFSEEDKAFLRARRSYIDTKVYKTLNLDSKIVDVPTKNPSDPEIIEEEGDEVDLEAMTVAELTELAKENKIDLGEATKKADIIKAIEAFLEA
ncbi:MAG: Rho termination factor N-terminal domain-containing protein [Candidatus Heimdallarchaeaceae archaeon]